MNSLVGWEFCANRCNNSQIFTALPQILFHSGSLPAHSPEICPIIWAIPLGILNSGHLVSSERKSRESICRWEITQSGESWGRKYPMVHTRTSADADVGICIWNEELSSEATCGGRSRNSCLEASRIESEHCSDARPARFVVQELVHKRDLAAMHWNAQCNIHWRKRWCTWR